MPFANRCPVRRLLLLAIAAGAANAARGAPPAADLPAVARAAAERYEAVTPQRLAAARRRARQAAAALDQALQRQPSVLAGWRAYLQWDEWVPALAEDAAVDREQLARLRAALRRLRANSPGLELPAFRGVAEALDPYLELAAWSAAAEVRDTRGDYARLLESTAVQLERHAASPTSETQWKVGRPLGVLESLGGASDLVQGVRQRYVGKNVYVHVSERLVNRLGSRPVDNQRPVRDLILGTTIVGQARTQGLVTFDAVPAADRMVLELRMTGAAQSRTTGYNGPVRIGSSGVTTLSAAQTIALSAANFSAGPTRTAADTETRIRSIDKTGGRFGERLVERVAWKRARQQQSQAEAIAARHAEQRLAAEFSAETARALAAGRRTYEQQLRAPLMRRDFLPSQMQFQSRSDAVDWAGAFATRRQLAASTLPPPIRLPYDAALQIHESGVSNYLPLALAGVTLSQQDPEQPPALRGMAPAWLRRGMTEGSRRLQAGRSRSNDAASQAADAASQAADAASQAADAASQAADEFRPWSLTLNEESPLSVTFDEGQATLRVRCAALESADSKYENCDLLVSYRWSLGPQGLTLRRSGPIEVFPTGFDPRWDERMRSADVGFRNTLSKNLNARAEAGEGIPSEIVVPPIAAWGRAGRLELADVASDDGWLTLVWRLPSTR